MMGCLVKKVSLHSVFKNETVSSVHEAPRRLPLVLHVRTAGEALGQSATVAVSCPGTGRDVPLLVAGGAGSVYFI